MAVQEKIKKIHVDLESLKGDVVVMKGNIAEIKNLLMTRSIPPSNVMDQNSPSVNAGGNIPIHSSEFNRLGFPMGCSGGSLEVSGVTGSQSMANPLPSIFSPSIRTSTYQYYRGGNGGMDVRPQTSHPTQTETHTETGGPTIPGYFHPAISQQSFHGAVPGQVSNQMHQDHQSGSRGGGQHNPGYCQPVLPQYYRSQGNIHNGAGMAQQMHYPGVQLIDAQRNLYCGEYNSIHQYAVAVIKGPKLELPTFSGDYPICWIDHSAASRDKLIKEGEEKMSTDHSADAHNEPEADEKMEDEDPYYEEDPEEVVQGDESTDANQTNASSHGQRDVAGVVDTQVGPNSPQLIQPGLQYGNGEQSLSGDCHSVLSLYGQSGNVYGGVTFAQPMHYPGVQLEEAQRNSASEKTNRSHPYAEASIKGPKLELSVLKGDNPNGWVDQCEEFLEMDGTPHEHWVNVAVEYLVGRSNTWLKGIGIPWGSVTWSHFCAVHCDRFSEDSTPNAVGKLQGIKHFSPVAKYIDYFEKCVELVKCDHLYLQENYLLSCFIGKLKNENKYNISSKPPRELLEVYWYVKMEEKTASARKSFSSGAGARQKATIPVKTEASSPSKLKGKFSQKNPSIGKLWWHCHEPWKPGLLRQCTLSNALHTLLMRGEEQNMVTEEKDIQADLSGFVTAPGSPNKEVVVDIEEHLMYILAYAAHGVDATITFSLLKYIGSMKSLALVDSESTYSFMNYNFAVKNGYSLSRITQRRVMVAGGGELITDAKVDYLQSKIQDTLFITTFKLPNRGNYDTSPEADWVYDYSPIELDLNEKLLTVNKNGHRTQFQVCTQPSDNCLLTASKLQKMVRKRVRGLFIQLNMLRNDNQIVEEYLSPKIEEILNYYADVFAELVGLPPKGDRDQEAIAILEALENWKHYLSGNSVTIGTEQQSLEFITSQKLVEAGALSRVDHSIANSEKCAAISYVIPEWGTTVEASFKPEAKVSKVMSDLQTGEDLNGKNRMETGICKYKGLLYAGDKSNLRSVLLDACHISALGSHSGVKLFNHKLKKVFYWSSLRRSVEFLDRKRPVCRLIKAKHIQISGLLMSLEISKMAKWCVSEEAEIIIEEKERMLRKLEENLNQAQNTMKRFADLLRTKYSGSFRVMSKVGAVACKLQLPADSRRIKIELVAILDRRIITRKRCTVTQWLSQWRNLAEEDATWEDTGFIQSTFQHFKLEDKFVLEEGVLSGTVVAGV